MKSGKDINRIQGDGYLILPLSMSRLATGQSPEVCYEILEHFLEKLETFSNDVILLYTNGLYFNAESPALETRKKTLQQSLNHIAAFRGLVEKRRKFIPGAIHYLPIDYVIFNAPQCKDFIDTLKERVRLDSAFRDVLSTDTRDGEVTEANMSFLIEEIAVTHAIRQKYVELPRTLVKSDAWRLVVYSGAPLRSDIYQWQHRILPRHEIDNPFAGAQYDSTQKKVVMFDEEEL